MNAVELSKGIYRVGANIENGDRFEGLWPIPDGVSLNCYAVIGEKKENLDMISIGPAMFDVHTPFERLNIDSFNRTFKFLCEIIKKI